MTKTLFAILTVAVALVACGEKAPDSAEAPQAPAIPSLSVDELLALNKNERQEMERRCLGSTDATCVRFKSDEFRNRDDLERSFCNTGKAMDRFTGTSMSNPKCAVYN